MLPQPAEDDSSAVVESAWFPLMPPAMAGEERRAAGRVTDSSAANVAPSETDGFAGGGCAQDEGGHEGSEGRWDTMEG